ncbi:hypothetical protein [Streptomyces xanthophaeus]
MGRGSCPYLERLSIAALDREHGASRGAIRTAVAVLMADHTAIEHEDVPAPELLVTLDMPGKVADFLRSADLEPAERTALDQGVTVRRGRDYTCASAPPRRCAASSSPTVGPSTAAKAPRPFHLSARPAGVRERVSIVTPPGP